MLVGCPLSKFKLFHLFKNYIDRNKMDPIVRFTPIKPIDTVVIEAITEIFRLNIIPIKTLSFYTTNTILH